MFSVQSNEVTSSNAMEMEGLQRAIAFLCSKEKKIGTLITDRHAQVAKWLRENHPQINHRYDVWHIAKGEKCATMNLQAISCIYASVTK